MINKVYYKNSYKDFGHRCKNLVIRCMDFRFHKQLLALLPEIFKEDDFDYDSPGVGGGASKSVIEKKQREVLFSAINIAISKHKLKRVIIVDHIDCGAYGGSGEHNSAIDEKNFHIDKLVEAKQILKKEYPELEIFTLYQDWNSLEIV